jgi:hypothetical protein
MMMRALLSLEEALAEVANPYASTITVRAEDAKRINLPETWIHATALDRDGEVTFLEPERLIRNNTQRRRLAPTFRRLR